MLDGAFSNILDSLEVNDIGHEAVHFRTASSDNTIQNSRIWNTGRTDAGLGEGVYIGTAGKDVNCDRNKVLNNKFGPYVRAECIDIKEASFNNTISGNEFDGTGSREECWVAIKGTNNLIENNVGRVSKKYGFEVRYKIY